MPSAPGVSDTAGAVASGQTTGSESPVGWASAGAIQTASRVGRVRGCLRVLLLGQRHEAAQGGARVALRLGEIAGGRLGGREQQAYASCDAVTPPALSVTFVVGMSETPSAPMSP